MSDEHPQEPDSGEPIDDGANDNSGSPDQESSVPGDKFPLATPDEFPSPPDSPPLVTQSEVDEAIAARASEPDLLRTFPGMTEPHVPQIEKEPITDPELLRVLFREEDIRHPSPEVDATSKEPEPISTGDDISPAHEEPAVADSMEETDSVPSKLLSQEHLDALEAAAQDHPRHSLEELMKEGEGSEIEREEITDPAIAGLLLGTDDGGTDSKDALDEDPKTQSSIDDSAEAETHDSGDQAELEAIEQADIDSLLSDSVATGPSANDTPDSGNAANLGAIEQADVGEPQSDSVASDSSIGDTPLSGKAEIDPLTAGLNAVNDPGDEESPEESGPQEASSDEWMDTPLEDELASIADGDTETVLAGGEVEEVLDATDMDDLLDASGDADLEVVTEGDEDPLSNLVAEESEPTEAVGGENVAAAGSTEPEGPGEALPEGVLDQLVQDPQEGAAGPGAGGEEQSTPSEEEEVEALQVQSTDIEEELAPAEADDDEHPRRAPISFSFGEAATGSPTKALSALVAGIVVTLATFSYLYVHRFQDRGEKMGPVANQSSDLTRAMARARQLMDKRAYLEAVSTLDEAIAGLPVSSERTDAQFLQVEARFLALPQRPSSMVADQLHADIDRLVEFTRAHPSAPEVLFWKAKLYEREENPIAARSEYRGILNSFGNASNLDRVLYALGELELKTNRSPQAIGYLQRITQEFPTSPLAPMARILTGDAFAAAGDAEGARKVYILSAQAHPNDMIGARAFERLGRLAFDSGDYAAAIRELEERIDSATTVEGMDTVYLLFSRSLRASGDYARAQDTLNELIDFFPESNVTPLAYVELSKTMNDLGMTGDAVRLATETVERYPDNLAVLRNAGVLLTISGDAQSAARALMAAVGAGANEPSLLLAAGRQFKKANDLAAAKYVLEQLAIAHPSSGETLEGGIEWAKVMYAMGRPTTALERLENLALSTAERPQRLLVLTAMGQMYLELGMETAATDTLSRVVTEASDAETLADASIALLGINASGAIDLGLAAAARVDVSSIPDTTAYAFLMKFGEARLRGNARSGLEAMEQAHAAYPQERTTEGVQKLLKANLTIKRAARARAIVTELQTQAARDPLTAPQLEQAATLYGDFLFARGDYRAAADAYALGMGSAGLDAEGVAPTATLSEDNWWNTYQRASALFELASFGESITLYDRVAASGSAFATEATSRAAVVRLEQRLRGLPVTPAAGTS